MNTPKQLIINPGSATIKCALFEGEKCILSARYERHGKRSYSRTIGTRKKTISKNQFDDAVQDFLMIKNTDSSDVSKIGIRYVSGGKKFQKTTRLTSTVRKKLKSLDGYAPLHNPFAREIIESIISVFPLAKIFLIFDTVFHQTIPESIAYSTLPKKLSKKYGIKKLGFHGIVCSSIVHQLQKQKRLKKHAIICHLGSGCSVTALENGKSVNNSMGFTPLGGMLMSTRSGSVDPGELIYLMEKGKYSPKKTRELLNTKAGIYGLTGEKDMRMLLKKAKPGNDYQSVVDMFCRTAAETIAQQSISLGSVEQIIFSGGIGENSPLIREKICNYLKPLGVKMSTKKNTTAKSTQPFQKPFSKIQLMWVNADEQSEMNRIVREA